jgi:hypothetical protein
MTLWDFDSNFKQQIHVRDLAAPCVRALLEFSFTLSNRATVLEVDRRTAGLKAGAERATAFGG